MTSLEDSAMIKGLDRILLTADLPEHGLQEAILEQLPLFIEAGRDTKLSSLHLMAKRWPSSRSLQGRCALSHTARLRAPAKLSYARRRPGHL